MTAWTYPRADQKTAGVLGEAWKALNTPLPNTPKIFAGRNLSALKGESTEVVKSIKPKSVEEALAARRASRAASWRPKTAAFWSFADELAKLAAEEGNLGQWWEEIGGPFLAKGGSHSDFAKKIDEAGFGHKKERLMRMAAERYPAGFGSAGKGSSARDDIFSRVEAAGKDLTNLVALSRLAGAAGLAYTYGADKKSDEVAAPSAAKAHIGALTRALPLAAYGMSVGKLTGAIADEKSYPIIGAAIGTAVGAALGELDLRRQMKEVPSLVRKALKDGEKSEKKLEDLAKKTPAGWARENGIISMLGTLLLPTALPSITELGRGAVAQHKYRTAYEEMKARKGTEKAAFQQSMYGDTGGFVDFHQISSQPGFKKPNLKTVVEKGAHFTDDEIPKVAFTLSELATLGVGATAGGVAGSRESVSPGQPVSGGIRGATGAVLGGAAARVAAAGLPKMNPHLQSAITLGSLPIGSYLGYKALTHDFSKKKEVAPAEKQAGALTPGGLTPQARLSSSMHIGAPKVTNPPGPSIAEVAKPRGLGSGHGLPGAFKGTIG